jgi:hypothetical protein
MAAEHIVEISGKPHTVSVYQPKSFWNLFGEWVAIGTCDGRPLEVVGRDELSAIEQWREAARLRRLLGRNAAGHCSHIG